MLKQGTQLKLFMTPGELMSSAVPGDHESQPALSLESFWANKEREARTERDWSRRGSGVYNSIAQEGVTSHAWLYHSDAPPKVIEGHHRVAAAAAVERDLNKQQFIPVYHSSDASWMEDMPDDPKHYPQNQRPDWDD